MTEDVVDDDPINDDEPRVTEEQGLVPEGSLKLISCQCTGGTCNKDRYDHPGCCRLWGKSCSASCACKGTCKNVWNGETKERLFGADDKDDEAFPTACFVSWFEKQPAMISDRTTMDTLFRRLIKSLENGDKYVPDGFNDIFYSDRGFHAVWKKHMEPYAESDDIRQVWTRRFVRYALTDYRYPLELALGTGDFDGYYYSFCDDDFWMRNPTRRIGIS